jgi:hypothetical protein
MNNEPNSTGTHGKALDEEARAMQDFFCGLAEADDLYARAVVQVPAALKQLNRSERGRRALRGFMRLIDEGADGLDATNWNALAVLCQACGYLPKR